MFAVFVRKFAHLTQFHNPNKISPSLVRNATPNASNLLILKVLHCAFFIWGRSEIDTNENKVKNLYYKEIHKTHGFSKAYSQN